MFLCMEFILILQSYDLLIDGALGTGASDMGLSACRHAFFM